MLSEKVYQRVKNMIYSGHLQPGERLVERDLSRKLGTSRAPLRETLVRLESEGLVRSVPNSASFVEDLTPSDVLEKYWMRLALEPLAARLATLQHQESLLVKLRKLCDLMTACTRNSDWAQLDRADYQFHRMIVDASRNKLLIRSYDNCHIQVTGVRASYTHLKDLSPDATANEHHLIVECIGRWDARAAEEAAREHVRRALAFLEDYLGVRVGTSEPQHENGNSARADGKARG